MAYTKKYGKLFIIAGIELLCFPMCCHKPNFLYQINLHENQWRLDITRGELPTLKK